jgi:hypothetical protein
MEIYIASSLTFLSTLFCVMPCIVDQCAHWLDWRGAESTGCR